MASQDRHDFTILPQVWEPATPRSRHATMLESAAAAMSTLQAGRAQSESSNMTPPPSTQVPSPARTKTRTPTPTASHISTPPPTVEVSSQAQDKRSVAVFSGLMSVGDVKNASLEELRIKVTELQAATHEAKMSAAHHKLQYQMLAKESAAAIERMAVEIRMVQSEIDVIRVAGQAKAAATPVQPSPVPEGMIPVKKDLYQRMCQELHELSDANMYLQSESSQQEKVITRQGNEIASLSDKVTLMRERLRENREHLNKMRHMAATPHTDNTPHSVLSTPRRTQRHHDQTQPFAALLQASEMASQEAGRPLAGGKKGHSRNTHSLSSLPATPLRFMQQHSAATGYHTPQGRQAPLKIPATAPAPRTGVMRVPDVYAQPALPVNYGRGPPSDEGTVSASDHDDDSEAETDIIEPEQDHEIGESQASRAASHMLRSSQEQQMKRDILMGNGMLGQRSSVADSKVLKQSKLFGAVRKPNVDRQGDEPPMKRARIAEPAAVGLGIDGARD